ncbi:MAG: tetratricopeptide repeat protein [Armatimonadetes bacterium]|nr:tetratricopeptide repeat protein [Armatimonadota bacterium]
MRLVSRLISGKKWQRSLNEGLRRFEAGQLEESAGPLRTAARLAQKMFSPRDRRYSETLLAAARALHVLGDPQAHELDRKAYEACRRYTGPESESTVEALLAWVGNPGAELPAPAQEPLLRQALSHCQRSGRQDHRCAVILGRLGYLRSRAGQASEAASLTRQALSLCETLHGRELDPRRIPDMAAHLGELCLAADLPEPALDFFRCSLRYLERRHGGDSAQAAEALHRLGQLSLLSQDVDRAVRYLRRSHQLRPSAMEVLASLGGSLHCAGELSEAEQCCRRYLSHVERELGPDSPRVAECLHHLMTVLYGQGQREQARAVLERILRLQARAPRELRLETARRLRCFGHCLNADEEAARFLREALRIRQELLRGKHPLVGQSLADLAAYAEPGSRERRQLEKQSQRLLRKVKPEVQRMLEAEDRALISQLGYWALLLERQDRRSEARQLREKADRLAGAELQPA